MLRIFLSIILFLMTTTTEAGSASSAIQPIMLNNSFKVDVNVIRLGDLFTNIGSKSKIAVAYSPEPGRRVHFDARWLYRIARTHRLNWRPINDKVRVVVSRASRVISREEIKDAVRDALSKNMISYDSEIELFDQFIKLHVPEKSLSGVSVDDIEFDARKQRFSAIISIPTTASGPRQLRLRGRVHKTTEVPVLRHRVLSGEIIKQKDIKWIKIRTRRLQHNAVAEENEIIGMSPKRSIRSGVPILLSSIRRPILVAKGSLVTMFLQAPQMTLSAQGKALENGSDGDVIPISNMHSKKIVEAEIIGHGKVAVRAPAQIAMN